MNSQLYHRLHELKKVLDLHFSDLGVILDYQFDQKHCYIMETIKIWEKELPSEMIASHMQYGDLLTIQIKFKSNGG